MRQPGISGSIFRPTKDFKEKEKRHWLIHQSFKKRLFVPLCFLMDKWLGKFMVREREDIPDECYNENFLILWDAFEEGIKQWHFNRYKIKHKPDGEIVNAKELKKTWKNKEKLHWWKIPAFFRNLMFTIILEDTAYREMLNCMLYDIQVRMNRQHKVEQMSKQAKDEIIRNILKNIADLVDFDGPIKHPMYTNRCDMDLAYAIEWLKKIGDKGKIEFEVKKEDGKKEPSESIKIHQKRDAEGDNGKDEGKDSSAEKLSGDSVDKVSKGSKVKRTKKIIRKSRKTKLRGSEVVRRKLSENCAKNRV